MTKPLFAILFIVLQVCDGCESRRSSASLLSGGFRIPGGKSQAIKEEPVAAEVKSEIATSASLVKLEAKDAKPTLQELKSSSMAAPTSALLLPHHQDLVVYLQESQSSVASSPRCPPTMRTWRCVIGDLETLRPISVFPDPKKYVELIHDIFLRGLLSCRAKFKCDHRVNISPAGVAESESLELSVRISSTQGSTSRLLTLTFQLVTLDESTALQRCMSRAFWAVAQRCTELTRRRQELNWLEAHRVRVAQDTVDQEAALLKRFVVLLNEKKRRISELMICVDDLGHENKLLRQELEEAREMLRSVASRAVSPSSSEGSAEGGENGGVSLAQVPAFAPAVAATTDPAIGGLAMPNGDDVLSRKRPRNSMDDLLGL